jgi:hypothetical protein
MRQTIILLLAASALAACADEREPPVGNASRTGVPRPADGPLNGSIDGEQRAAACPDGYEMGVLANKPTVAVVVNGHGPSTFVYDTGAPGTLIDSRLRAAIGPGPDTLVVAGRTLDAGTLPATDIAATYGFSGAMGIIGTDLLGRFVVNVDRARGRFWLSDHLDDPALAACSHVSGAAEIVAFTFSQYLYVKGQLEDVPGWFLVDSGATLGAVNDSVFATLLDHRPRPVLPGFYTRAGIGAFWAKMSTVGSMQVGSHLRVDHVPVRTIPDGILPAPPASDGTPFLGLLPNGFLRHMMMSVDYPGHRIRWAPFLADSLSEPSFLYSVGIGLEANVTQPPRAATVLAGSSAESSGIRAGDEILRIAGTDASTLGPDSAEWALTSFSAGASIPVTIRRTTTRTVTLVATDLLTAPQ